MARKRTGTLVLKSSGYFGRVWAEVEGPNGERTSVRKLVNLETTDRGRARRELAKIVRLIEEGKLVADARAAAVAPETVGSYATAWCARRDAAGVVMARDERHNLTAHVLPVVGAELPLTKFTDAHARDALEAARDKGLGHETVRKIRAALFRMFKTAKREKLIAENPIADLELPEGLVKDKRPRIVLVDAEIAAFMAAPRVDLELKMLSLVARTEGGMRTAELVRWDWSMIDREGFEACSIPRAKTGDIQRLEIPAVLRPFLRAWWAKAGSPPAGPVFPVRRGRNRGSFKKSRGTSFAFRLRRALFKAGIVRVPAIVDASGKRAPNPADPLYFDTKVSRRVDFHSFRRAFSTALARAGVNMQTAMALAAHSDGKTHMGYVMQLEAAKPIPVGALPELGEAAVRGLLAPTGDRTPKADHGDFMDPAFSSYARQESNLRHSASKADALSS